MSMTRAEAIRTHAVSPVSIASRFGVIVPSRRSTLVLAATPGDQPRRAVAVACKPLDRETMPAMLQAVFKLLTTRARNGEKTPGLRLKLEGTGVYTRRRDSNQQRESRSARSRRR